MAEAEDVITDAARHATIFARQLWKRHQGTSNVPRIIQLAEVADRLDLLIGAVFGIHYPLRTAQAPAARTLLARLFRRNDLPSPAQAVPSTDGRSLWLPADLQSADFDLSLGQFRTMALQQAMRAFRGNARKIASLRFPMERDTCLIVEACASDQALIAMLPGLEPAVQALRQQALAARPPLPAISPLYHPLERLLRTILASPCTSPPPELAGCMTPAASVAQGRKLALQLAPLELASSKWGKTAVYKDRWTGDVQLGDPVAAGFNASGGPGDTDGTQKPRSAQLTRRPKVRDAVEDEDDDEQGVWMIQPSQPNEHAEDPMGMQRPTDQDGETPPEEFADSLSELAEARLVSTPGSPKDILLSDDPPQAHAGQQGDSIADTGSSQLRYPEWDCRIGAYRDPGVTVHLSRPGLGPMEWVKETLEKHQSMLGVIQRRFEMLRPERVRLRKQLEGDDIDLAAYTEALADRRAGLAMPQGLYESQRPGKRDMAIMLLIDISGSTDSWLSSAQRVIDVEREALLLVCTALEGLSEPYSVQAFSGEGPQGVSVSAIKDFGERYDMQVAQRIAALEPDRYTRTGAALRHASMLLMKQPAQHRLLMLLSDGKPNDADEYDGRYGVEDMRQAVNEAKLQGIFPFCLTIDRQAASYLPAVFGPRQYALLSRPEMLPTVLLDWMRRLLA